MGKRKRNEGELWRVVMDPDDAGRYQAAVLANSGDPGGYVVIGEEERSMEVPRFTIRVYKDRVEVEGPPDDPTASLPMHPKPDFGPPSSLKTHKRAAKKAKRREELIDAICAVLESGSSRRLIKAIRGAAR